MEIKKLNSLRCIASLIVVVSHYSNDAKLLNGVFGKGAGQFGVMLFFILSGFLISYLYMGKEFGRSEVYGYVVARVARVVPLFLLIVLFSYLFQKIGVTGVLYDIANKETLVAHIALISGVSVLWTIPPEIQFYLIFIFLWWFWRKRQTQLTILLLLLVIALMCLKIPRFMGSLSGIPYDTALIRSLPYFIVGVLFGRLYVNWKVPENMLSRLYAISFFLIPLLYPEIFKIITGGSHKMWMDIGILFSVSVVFFAIVFLVPDDYTLFSNKVGDFLGKISYSLYLIHIPILRQIESYAIKSPGLFLPVFLVLSIMVSYVSYLIIENPSRSAIRTFASNIWTARNQRA